jgi:hypothetical protein
MNGDFLFFVFFLLIFITGMIFRGVFGRRSPDFKKSGRELIQQAFEHESRLSMALQILIGNLHYDRNDYLPVLHTAISLVAITFARLSSMDWSSP